MLAFIMRPQSEYPTNVLRLIFFKIRQYHQFNVISSNTLSTFILHHNLNRLCDNNIHSIQDLMCTSKPSRDKFKCVCRNLPNTAILTKSTTPGKPQLMFVHAFVGNKSLGESVTAFTLTGLLKAPKLVSTDADIAFINAGDKIRTANSSD